MKRSMPKNLRHIIHALYPVGRIILHISTFVSRACHLLMRHGATWQNLTKTCTN